MVQPFSAGFVWRPTLCCLAASFVLPQMHHGLSERDECSSPILVRSNL